MKQNTSNQLFSLGVSPRKSPSFGPNFYDTKFSPEQKKSSGRRCVGRPHMPAAKIAKSGLIYAEHSVLGASTLSQHGSVGVRIALTISIWNRERERDKERESERGGAPGDPESSGVRMQRTVREYKSKPQGVEDQQSTHGRVQ